jgi:hypothetical protein
VEQEFDSLQSNKTWSVVGTPFPPFSPCRRVVNNMWIYKVKTDNLDYVSIFKALFVVNEKSLTTRSIFSLPSFA